jgi:hypothetical protein
MTWELLLKMLDAFYLKSLKISNPGIDTPVRARKAAPHPVPLPASGAREIVGEIGFSRGRRDRGAQRIVRAGFV